MSNLFNKIKYDEKYTICNERHKQIEYDYVVKVIKKLDKNTFLRKYLIKFLKITGHYKAHKEQKNHKYVYMSENVINQILSEIKYKKENGEFRIYDK